MGEMVGDIFGGMDEIGGQLAIARRFEAAQAAQGRRRRHALRYRANAANARRDDQRVIGGPPDQNLLEAAIKRRGHLRAGDDAGLNVQRQLQIAFDAVERSDDDAIHLLRLGFLTMRSASAFLRTRSGVADFDSAANAMNQALGMSSGRPTGMPPIFGVAW